MKVLLTSPEYDAITRYLRVWSLMTVDNYKGIVDFVHLDKKRANRKNFEGVLKKHSFDVAMLNGHGADDRMAGDEGEIILDGDNALVLSGVSVHALSCKTAKKLGEMVVEKGAKAFIGYDESFILVHDETKLSKPEDDATAKLFLDAAFVAPKSLMNGKDVSEAIVATKREYDRSIIKALNSDIQSDDDQFIKYLIWDKNHLKGFDASGEV